MRAVACRHFIYHKAQSEQIVFRGEAEGIVPIRGREEPVRKRACKVAGHNFEIVLDEDIRCAGVAVDNAPSMNLFKGI